jgi:hypothetical protein
MNSQSDSPLPGSLLFRNLELKFKTDKEIGEKLIHLVFSPKIKVELPRTLPVKE